MASLSKNPAQKIVNCEKFPENNVDPIESDFIGLKPSHSQGQLSIQTFQ